MNDAVGSRPVGDRLIEKLDKRFHILERLTPTSDKQRVGILKRIEYNAPLFGCEHFCIKRRENAMQHGAINIFEIANFCRHFRDLGQFLDLFDHLTNSFELGVCSVVDDHNV